MTSDAESMREASGRPKLVPCDICGFPVRPRGRSSHERACDRHQTDDDEDTYRQWLGQRMKLWKARHKHDGQQRLPVSTETFHCIDCGLDFELDQDLPLNAQVPGHTYHVEDHTLKHLLEAV